MKKSCNDFCRAIPRQPQQIFDRSDPLLSATCILQVLFIFALKRKPNYGLDLCTLQPDKTVIVSLTSRQCVRIVSVTSNDGRCFDPSSLLIACIPSKDLVQSSSFVTSHIIRPSVGHVSIPLLFPFGAFPLVTL